MRSNSRRKPSPWSDGEQHHVCLPALEGIDDVDVDVRVAGPGVPFSLDGHLQLCPLLAVARQHRDADLPPFGLALLKGEVHSSEQSYDELDFEVVDVGRANLAGRLVGPLACRIPGHGLRKRPDELRVSLSLDALQGRVIEALGDEVTYGRKHAVLRCQRLVKL